MSFYDKLQLDPFVLKRMIHKSESPRERKYLFMVMLIRSILLVGFAIFFISTINLVFGSENSYLAVILFCMLLSLRFVHFGYKLTQSVISLAIILGIFFLIPLIGQLDSLTLRFFSNLLGLSVILLLTSNKPQMGNPGLYSFGYIFLTGTSITLSHQQLLSRGYLLITAFVLFAVIFVLKHEGKNLTKSFHNILTEDGYLGKKNLWLLYYALGVSVILEVGYLTNIKRYMWVGIAFSSLISIYENSNIKGRFFDRILGVVFGTLLFLILVQVIPSNVLGILGGVMLGLCTTYRFKNIFNCFGALALATTLFGNTQASFLRISNNLLGLVLGLVYLTIGQIIYRKIVST